MPGGPFAAVHLCGRFADIYEILVSRPQFHFAHCFGVRYVRTHLVQEFSCSLLAITLAVMQFFVFRLANGGGLLLIKVSV